MSELLNLIEEAKTTNDFTNINTYINCLVQKSMNEDENILQELKNTLDSLNFEAIEFLILNIRNIVNCLNFISNQLNYSSYSLNLNESLFQIELKKLNAATYENFSISYTNSSYNNEIFDEFIETNFNLNENEINQYKYIPIKVTDYLYQIVSSSISLNNITKIEYYSNICKFILLNTEKRFPSTSSKGSYQSSTESLLKLYQLLANFYHKQSNFDLAFENIHKAIRIYFAFFNTSLQFIHVSKNYLPLLKLSISYYTQKSNNEMLSRLENEISTINQAKQDE
eukprot:TRINITY_DN3971_c0_g1_i1.p1 TRINITY_DN3971_c0_g1~~TRINITY_DN3971_c0_g1_i1.p1  ORF type:complete len:283 (-),score=58.53 TRINITY_DN3971_c0_g1_i1:139-987(-)